MKYGIKRLRMWSAMIAIFVFAVVFMASCKEEKKNEQVAQIYKTMEIATSDITIENTYSASIQGRQNVKLLPRVEGYLVKVLATEGQKVKKGESLFLIDDVPYFTAYQAAKAHVVMSEANVATAKLTYKSKLSLYKKEIVSEFDLLTAENALKTAEAALLQSKANEASASNNLSYTDVKSPVDGVLGKIPYREGDYVSSAIPYGLTVVADNSLMYVYYSMTEDNVLDLLYQYDNMQVAIDSMPAIGLKLSNAKLYSEKGKIESISGVIDQGTGAVSIRAVFDNPKGYLISGGAGTIVMPATFKDVIVIPQESTYEIQNMTYVYKVIDGIAKASIIEVDPINNGKQYIVSKGLSVGERIIQEGVVTAREGMKIK